MSKYEIKFETQIKIPCFYQFLIEGIYGETNNSKSIRFKME